MIGGCACSESASLLSSAKNEAMVVCPYRNEHQIHLWKFAIFHRENANHTAAGTCTCGIFAIAHGLSWICCEIRRLFKTALRTPWSQTHHRADRYGTV